MVTQAVINDALATAIENGYFDGDDDDLAKWTIDEIVQDLLCYCHDCEDATEEELTPLVQTWYDAQKNGAA